MAVAIEVPRGAVDASLNFFEPPADGAIPFNYVDAPPAGEPQNNFGKSTHEVQIDDIRGHEGDYTLDRDAFLVVQGVPPSAEHDFVDDDSIRARYYPEVEALLLQHVPGSNKVFIFDHTIRRSRPDAPRAPVTRVHIDQTAQSVAQRVRRHLPADEAERLLRGRYRIINVWRPLNKNPVESFPLAFASSASLADDDVVPVEHRYPHGYVGQTAGIKYNPAQKWHYLSAMTGSERLLLECFDSEALKEGSSVRGGRLAHTALRIQGRGRVPRAGKASRFGPWSLVLDLGPG